jgi:hypothetical protein
MPYSPLPAADTAPADRRSIDDLDREICALARHMNAQTYRLLMLVREFDDRFGWAKWGLRNCAEWLAWRCGLSLSAAREKVRTAQALRGLPAISAAFADGRLSYSKARALTRVSEMHEEDSLLDYALRATAPQVEERCRQIRNVAPESSFSAWRAWERRSLTLLRDEARGIMRMSVEVPLEQGEVIAKALERAAENGDSALGMEFTGIGEPSAEGVRDAADGPHGLAERARGSVTGAPGSAVAPTANGWRAQQADALVAMAKAYLNGGNDSGISNGSMKPCSAADHHQVVIHTDASALRGGISVDDSAVPEGLGRADLPIETVRRLTCDGSLITIVEDEDGTPLDVGRKRRTVTTALRRALWARDRHCSFPGCHNRWYVDAHHIEHWASGGKTSLENLTLLCTFHHTLLHEGGFKIRRDTDGAIYFQRPDGRVIPRFGYRHDDMRDEYAVAENPSVEGRPLREMNPSAEACQWLDANPSVEGKASEVREPTAVYYLTAQRSHSSGADAHWAALTIDPRQPRAVGARRTARRAARDFARGAACSRSSRMPTAPSRRGRGIGGENARPALS